MQFFLRTIRVLGLGFLLWLFVSSFQEERLEKTLFDSFYAELGCIKGGLFEKEPFEVDVDVLNLSADSICVTLKIFLKSDVRG
ncbi:hypothetical protein [Sphingobacterium sp. SGR-19]|uniref:hypothetical protein n=1 Tax=Sphingobacterium sp. SGR-19 TaxID=2710886 RepID=UPI0013ECBD29|nr:hypothetical protein [Sphingobacterium sp. SGR-19]NGM66105.1 hypothetical protein [Sphingobacterium sp. SGR-19]